MNDNSQSDAVRHPDQAAPDSIAEGQSSGQRQAAATAPKSPPSARAAPRPEAAQSTGLAGSWRYTFSSLGERDFLFLWLGMLTMMGGMQMQMLARGYLVYEITGSASLLGVVNAGAALPMLGLALFGGAVADRLERKRIIQVGQALAAALALIVGILIATNYIVWYYLLLASVLQGALFAFMMPARQAIIPQLVGTERLSNAMALNAAAMSATTLTAPAVAGGLYAFAGPHNVYFVIAALGASAVFFTSLISKAGGGPTRSTAPMVRDIIAGLAHIRNSRLVMLLLLMALATTLFAMPFRFLMPVFVVDVYRLGPDSMGLLVAIMGVGSLVGSLFIAAIGHWRRGLLLIIGSFISGIALLLLVAFPFYFAGAAFMILLGLGDSGRRTLNQSLIMEEVEDRFRGRVMSVFMMNFGLMPLGVLPTGLIADFLGIRVAVAILAVLLLATSSVIATTQTRLRQMP